MFNPSQFLIRHFYIFNETIAARKISDRVNSTQKWCRQPEHMFVNSRNLSNSSETYLAGNDRKKLTKIIKMNEQS